jgi:hypothetical protein
VKVVPLRAIPVKMRETDAPDEDIPKRLDEKADELIELRAQIARRLRGPAELASSAAQAVTRINKGNFDVAPLPMADEQSSRCKADLLSGGSGLAQAGELQSQGDEFMPRSRQASTAIAMLSCSLLSCTPRPGSDPVPRQCAFRRSAPPMVS